MVVLGFQLTLFCSVAQSFPTELPSASVKAGCLIIQQPLLLASPLNTIRLTGPVTEVS